MGEIPTNVVDGELNIHGWRDNSRVGAGLGNGKKMLSVVEGVGGNGGGKLKDKWRGRGFEGCVFNLFSFFIFSMKLVKRKYKIK